MEVTTTNSSYFDEDDDVHDYQREELNLFYAVSEILVAVVAVIGNAMVIMVFRKERRLRRRTNYYIVSLAAADFLVGLLGIPFAILSSIGLPTNLYACLFTVSLLVVLCTISIFCLVAVSVDRYWAILHPMGYSRNVRTKTALVIISICWFAGTVIGFLPLMGWHKGPAENGRCFFLGVMDYNYLVFLYFGTIITPALLLAIFYAHIYHVVLKQLRQIVTISPGSGSGLSGRSQGGTMLRMLGAAQKREVKATQNLSIIVLFFMICWIPLYTINCTLAFCKDCKVNSTFVLFCIILSHLNSAGNPLLYAYHLRDFRAALKSFISGIFGIESNSPPPNTINCITHPSNYSRYRIQSLRTTNNSLSRNRLMTESPQGLNKPRSHTPTSKISTLVGNSVALVAATAEANRDIWRISEISEAESNKLGHPGIEYHNTSAYLDDGDDDVFLDNTVQITELTCGENNIKLPAVKIQKFTQLSTSSPQLSRNVFVIDKPNQRSSSSERPDLTKNHVISGDFIHSPAKTFKLSPFKAVGELLKPKQSRSSSLNEEPEGPSHRNGYVPENHSSGI